MPRVQSIRIVSALCLAWATYGLRAQGAGAGAVEVSDLGGNQYRATFRLVPPAGTKRVFVAGTFNHWRPNETAMEGPDAKGAFTVRVVVNRGRHEYKFVLEGETWMSDPDNPHKSRGYQNSLLFAGVPIPGDPDTAVPKPEPTRMAAYVEHPPEVRELAKTLQAADPNQRKVGIDEWFADHTMPLYAEPSYADRSVTFVFADSAADAVTLSVSAHGSRAGYKLEPLFEGAKVFVVSLDRGGLPARSAYTYVVRHGDQTDNVLDPHAWSVTSRANRPAGWIVEPSASRGRIEVIRNVKSATGRLRPRDVYVYLPPGYDAKATNTRRYPVLYLHDGQNCWDDPVEPFGHGGWCYHQSQPGGQRGERV